MDHTDRLTLLALHDAAHGARCLSGVGSNDALDPRTGALVRLAALMAVGGAVPSYGALVDEALSAGATPAEIVEALEWVVPVVGLPRAAAAAHKVALALGYAAECEWDQRLEV